jgi:hypothetical protein
MLDQHTTGPGLLTRLIAALRLDLALYEEVSRDPAASAQAFRIVLLAGLSNGLGLVVRIGAAGILAGVGAALLGWVLWAGVIWLTARVFGHRRAGRSLLRVLGFADAPCVFLFLGALPTVGAAIRFLVVVWLLATTVRAVQSVYVVATRRAVVITALGFLLYLVLGALSAHFAS